MTERPTSIARHRLERAREILRDAELLLSSNALISATNRLYYAAFYAARACLATKDLDPARHSRVISLFQQQFVRSGLIDPGVARALSRAFERRQTSDYEDFAAPMRADVETLDSSVKRFVDACADVVARAQAADD